MIFDSCTFAWHTGQLTISAEEEDEEIDGIKLCIPAEEWREEVEADEEEVVVAVAILCCIAGVFVLTNSLGAAELLPNVFWKKSKMLEELLLSSHGLFLDA